MPKVKGPLMSLSASGVFADVMEFKTSAKGTIVTKVKHITKGLSQAQIDQAERFKDATTGWRALTDQQKLNWKTTAIPVGLNGYQLYIREYLAQGITPPGQPL